MFYSVDASFVEVIINMCVYFDLATKEPGDNAPVPIFDKNKILKEENENDKEQKQFENRKNICLSISELFFYDSPRPLSYRSKFVCKNSY